jgi:hypothetical protein
MISGKLNQTSFSDRDMYVACSVRLSVPIAGGWDSQNWTKQGVWATQRFDVSSTLASCLRILWSRWTGPATPLGLLGTGEAEEPAWATAISELHCFSAAISTCMLNNMRGPRGCDLPESMSKVEQDGESDGVSVAGIHSIWSLFFVGFQHPAAKRRRSLVLTTVRQLSLGSG